LGELALPSAEFDFEETYKKLDDEARAKIDKMIAQGKPCDTCIHMRCCEAID
jgi:hypothetical protein